MKQKIYVIGKVIGESISNCTAKFEVINEALEKRGFEVQTPLTVVGSWDMTTSQSRFRRKIALSMCNAVYILPCVIDCIDAKSDLDYAIGHNPGMTIYHELKNVESDGNDNL